MVKKKQSNSIKEVIEPVVESPAPKKKTVFVATIVMWIMSILIVGLAIVERSRVGAVVGSVLVLVLTGAVLLQTWKQ